MTETVITALSVAEKFVTEYEWDDGESGHHVPTEFEQVMMLDMVNGLFADDHFLAALRQEQTAGVVKGLEGQTWFEIREPGCVPERKGPKRHTEVAGFLRELFAARPASYITVVTVGPEGPLFEDGPQCLQMLDGRSMSVGRRHIASSRKAHEPPTPSPFPKGEEPVSEAEAPLVMRLIALAEGVMGYADLSQPAAQIEWIKWRDAKVAALRGATAALSASHREGE